MAGVGVWNKQSAAYFKSITRANTLVDNVFHDGPRSGMAPPTSALYLYNVCMRVADFADGIHRFGDSIVLYVLLAQSLTCVCFLVQFCHLLKMNSLRLHKSTCGCGWILIAALVTATCGVTLSLKVLGIVKCVCHIFSCVGRRPRMPLRAVSVS